MYLKLDGKLFWPRKLQYTDDTQNSKYTIVLFIGLHQQSEHSQVRCRYYKGNLKDKAKQNNEATLQMLERTLPTCEKPKEGRRCSLENVTDELQRMA